MKKIKIIPDRPSHLDWMLDNEIDACITTEDDTHVVVALRIPKEVIRRNFPFLVALFEAAQERRQ